MEIKIPVDQYLISEYVLIDDTNIHKIICRKCKEVLKEPIYTCINCHRFWCGQCLSLNQNPGQICPDKCGDTLMIATHVEKQLIMRVNFKCPSYKNQGQYKCQKALGYRDIFGHIDSCQYLPMRCTNRPCMEKFPKCLKDNHLQKCIFKRVNCKSCGQSLLQSAMDAHHLLCKKELSGMSPIKKHRDLSQVRVSIPMEKCEFCDKKMPIEDFVRHNQNMCSKEQYKKLSKAFNQKSEENDNLAKSLYQSYEKQSFQLEKLKCYDQVTKNVNRYDEVDYSNNSLYRNKRQNYRYGDNNNTRATNRSYHI